MQGKINMIYNFPKREIIFVIHSEKDHDIVKELEDHFEDVFFGDTNFKIDYLYSGKGDYLGDDFGKIIRKKIKESKWRIIIITENSRCSPWVNQEIGYSFCKSGKRSLVMIQKELLKISLGFIHSNIDKQPFTQIFTYGKFNIDKIEDKLIGEYGKKTIINTVEDLWEIIKPQPENSKVEIRKLPADFYVV